MNKKNRKTTQEIFADLSGQDNNFKSSIRKINSSNDLCPWDLSTFQSVTARSNTSKTKNHYNRSLSCINTPRLCKSKNENSTFGLTYQNSSSGLISQNTTQSSFRKTTFSADRLRTVSSKSSIISTLFDFSLRSIPSIHQLSKYKRNKLNSNLLSLNNRKKQKIQNIDEVNSRLLIKGRKLKQRRKIIRIPTMNIEIHV